MARYKIIVNPIAGRGAGKRAVPLVEQTLCGYGLDFDIVHTEYPWHATDWRNRLSRKGTI